MRNVEGHGFSHAAKPQIRFGKVDAGTTKTYVYNSRGMRAGLAGAENLFDLNGNIVSVVTPGTATLAYNRYTVGGRLLAANLSGTTDFYHQDWLGGIRAGSSLSGSLIDSCTNLPFGDGTNNCGLWYFAGLMSDPWDTLNTSATRSQSSTSGRWLTPDPAGLAAVDPSNPQTWNRYAYVLNNPVSYSDPLGLDPGDDGLGVGGDSSGGSEACPYDTCTTVTETVLPPIQFPVIFTGGNPGTGPIQVPGTTVDVTATFPNGAANNSKPSKTACFLRGAAVGAGGALVVGGLAVGAVALGAPAAAVTGVLLVAGGIGGASTLYSAGTNIANGNYSGAAYDVGTLGGGVAAGGLIGGVVGDSINPPATRGWSFGRDLANRYNPALGSVGSWLGTGPDAAAAGGGTGASGSGLGRFLRFLKGGC
jgi:RHS repeat-associated protein